MEDYIYQIRKYLPIKFADDEANKFLQYLEESYLENIRNQKYQFAFIAFHMLYMTFCYKTKWFLKTQNNQQINQTLQDYIKNRDKKAFFNVLFDLSHFPEKDTIDSLLRSLQGFHSNDIENCKIHITKRNHCTHASGKIEYEENDIDYISSDELKYIEKIQSKIKPDLKKFFEKFLNDKWNKFFIGSDIENFFTESSISTKDLELIVELELILFTKKSDNEDVIFQKILYLVFINEAQKYLELDKNIFVEKLPMFMISLSEEIKVKRDQEEKISLRQIIEENLIPIINKFGEEDRKKAEKILNL